MKAVRLALHLITTLLFVAAGSPVTVRAQTPAPAKPKVAKIEATPAALELAVGDSVKLTATAFDADGKPVEIDIRYFSRSPKGVSVSQEGWVKATEGGEYIVAAVAMDSRPVFSSVTVKVRFPPIQSVAVHVSGKRLLVGATLANTATAIDRAKGERKEIVVTWSTSNPAIATVTPTGMITGLRPGSVLLRATAERVTGEYKYTVETNPIRNVKLLASALTRRTGDVIHFTAIPYDAAGREVANAPISYSVSSTVEDTVIAQFPSADIDDKGRFVAQRAGYHTVFAVAAGVSSQATVSIANRNVSQEVKLVGRSSIQDKHTSDLYVWQGKDGRDYMIAGMWGAGGQAYFYDVTDAAHQVLIDSVVVDARTVNDVYVDETGTICVITREGASNRKNGIVIIDCTDPHHVKVLSNFDDGLYGGVHNVNIWKNYVFAINAGTRFDVIDIKDPVHPKRVGFFELSTPGHGIHDVWVVDGIAYASQWGDGVILVDVGNGKYGGSPEKPVQFASYKYPLGSTHAAYPYKNPNGKFYVITGDEIFPEGLNIEPGSAPVHAAGYAHIIDFTDPQHPEEVARYEVPEAGSHNFWVEGEKLYASFYNGGMRVVDISGELKGNLYFQGREIARFFPFDPKGVIANAPFTMGPQLYKGNIFMADWNSGLWTVKLEPRKTALVP